MVVLMVVVVVVVVDIVEEDPLGEEADEGELDGGGCKYLLHKVVISELLKEFPDSTKISLTNYCIDVLRTDGITSSEGAVALTCIFGISKFEVSEEVFNFRFKI